MYASKSVLEYCGISKSQLKNQSKLSKHEVPIRAAVAIAL